MELGFVGLGLMGRPMARHLMAGGHRVHVHNRSRGVVEELRGEGAEAASSSREVAERAEVVFTCLPNVEQVENVYFGSDGLLANARPGQLFVDHSTVGLDTTRKSAAAARERGAEFLDAPVSGGPGGAQAASLTIMVGGEPAAFDRALPLFQLIGKNVRLCGPTGAGTAVKLVNQLLVAITVAGISEALVFGIKAGADPQTILEVVGTGFGGSRMLDRNIPLILDRNFKPGTSVNLLVKDLGLIHSLAAELGTRLEVGRVAQRVFEAGRDAGLGDDDMAGLVRPYEQAAGVEVRRRD
ncbi:MAG TPA: NAD(P)-dependent oxidoreductase [Chloroflexota bacterium]|jgi:3-hydroxyisobutyrate dehydrogenase/2-hydroxy-3-oxopropionate reductase